MFDFFKRKKIPIDKEKMPRHIAIIMDGNGRWAKKRGLPRSAGHRFGAQKLREIILFADEIGLKYITVYAFSTENWKRPKDEVENLMNLLREFFDTEIENLINKTQIRIRVIGDISKLDKDIQERIISAEERTKDKTGLCVVIALNYGGRSEIVNAVKNLALDIKSGKIDIEAINEELFKNYLYTKDIPDPDLLIRPSGEMRVSNFLLWQISYTEFWFSNVLWPDFKKEHLLKAIEDYQKRERRFGGVK
ncbi:undecaprenyl diphosphate synthase [Caldicellulosiruptor saccharolyticus DSM 8903]|uniref:Isoprenyl transferase n=1 Tax=Caldicellulosiruptor saccharolyticus (strain ATCC 43494 / DSM 8903 / Tp8T 6331) TaxID=351627 RepID=A4XLZ8_CALS8|nr:isoprenyl transferase [Caldicellulosiruptor saccharolyticus]ABP67933.1 undecaprenyl diphosphate synthase [Caldicellulosiruptor saccharolyticus DSM 8903]